MGHRMIGTISDNYCNNEIHSSNFGRTTPKVNMVFSVPASNAGMEGVSPFPLPLAKNELWSDSSTHSEMSARLREFPLFAMRKSSGYAYIALPRGTREGGGPHSLIKARRLEIIIWLRCIWLSRLRGRRRREWSNCKTSSSLSQPTYLHYRVVRLKSHLI